MLAADNPAHTSIRKYAPLSSSPHPPYPGILVPEVVCEPDVAPNPFQGMILHLRRFQLPGSSTHVVPILPRKRRSTSPTCSLFPPVLRASCYGSHAAELHGRTCRIAVPVYSLSMDASLTPLVLKKYCMPTPTFRHTRPSCFLIRLRAQRPPCITAHILSPYRNLNHTRSPLMITILIRTATFLPLPLLLPAT